MALPDPIPDSLAELISQRFRVLGEPTRIRMLDHLRHGEATVQQLTSVLETSQQNISKHLAVLAQAGIVARRKEGNHVVYWIADTTVFALCEQVCGSLSRQLDALNELLGEPLARSVR